ncbi:family 43 glycosylhydrolase [bacterium]|nr:family 43 glycosylhydrolase [bacterium]
MMMKSAVRMLATVVFLCLVSTDILKALETEGNAQNPVIWADVPDPSVIRAGDVYYMSSTTMHMNPGLPIMKSMDLVNWEIVSYAYETLADNNAMNLRAGQDAYGDGSWASSIRYHNGTYYVVTFSYTTGKTHIYQTDDVENGSWSAYTLSTVCHDPSLLFDGDRVYVVYGIDDIRIIELTADVTAVKPGGLNQVLIPRSSEIAGTNFYVSAEGSHIYKLNGKYYVFLISWPAGSMRTELVYRSDTLTGPYEGRIALQDDGIAQGGLIDTPGGDWYAFLFQDHGSVGRIPYLVPVAWEEDWPVLGVNGQVPDALDIPVENDALPKIVASDEFDWDSVMPLVWQWNHNPDNGSWSVTDRPGFFRLINGRIDTGFLDTQNTLTQRTFGPECSGIVAMDVSGMLDGDVAGLGALQKKYGFVAVKMSGGGKSLIMVNGSSDEPKEVENVPLAQNMIFFKIACDFKYRRDRATFYYSLDGTEWNTIGNSLSMSYTLPHFMGYRFALFNYATESTGGMVDFDCFRIYNSLTGPAAVNHAGQNNPAGFGISGNYPNPFNPVTHIRYAIPGNGRVSLKVFDLLGREVATLFEGFRLQGDYEAELNGENLASGMYLCRLIAGNLRDTEKLILSK